jgi:hypothetical protein
MAETLSANMREGMTTQSALAAIMLAAAIILAAAVGALAVAMLLLR